MKTIIAGTRTHNKREDLHEAIKLASENGIHVDELVCGMGGAVDMASFHWAKDKGIPVKTTPAEWTKYGHAAGSIRNQKMAEYADALIAIWDSKSPGTKDMIERAKVMGLKIFVYKVRYDRTNI